MIELKPFSLRRILVALAALCVVAAAAAVGSAPIAQAQDGITVDARSAILVDVRTGDVLVEQDVDLEMGPASLVKMMTMYLVFEALDDGQLALDQEVETDEDSWAAAFPGSSVMFLEPGDRVTVEELLYGLSVASGNDASVALAKAVSGSEEAFVERMNQRGSDMGLDATRFANSHGLADENQYTTARDAATLGARLLNDYPESIPYLIQESFSYRIAHPQRNRNGLIFRDDRVTGLKTGYTSQSGYHLAASAQEDEMHLVAVVMGVEAETESQAFLKREQEARRLYDYGFRNFQTVAFPWQEAGEEVRVWKGRQNWVSVEPAIDPVMTIPRDTDMDAVEIRFEIEGPVEAPVEAGQRLGDIVVELPGDGGERTYELLAAEEVERGNIFKVLWDTLRMLFAGFTGGS